MERNVLTQEELERLFQQYHPPQTSWAMVTPYKSLKDILTLQSSLDWCRLLVSLSILHFVIITYVNYRQYKVLQRPERPKTLQNVITHETYSAVTTHERAEIWFYCWSGLYELIVTLLLVYCEILPKIWINVTIFLWSDLGRSMDIAYNKEFGHTLRCPLFYVACGLLWTTIHLPVTYVESCILGSSHTSTKSTPREWITKICKDQMWTFVKVYILVITQEKNQMDFSFDPTYRAAFDTMCLAGVFYLVYELVILPFMHAKWLQLYPLRAGKTRTALEKLVRDSGLALGDVYTLPNSKRNASDIDVLIFGPFWRRSIAIYEDVLEKCNTQDIVALTAGELRSWKQNPIVGNGLMFLYYAIHATCIWTVLFNWKAICTSFGFKMNYTFTAQHPFQVIVLMLGDALHPVYHLIYVPFNASFRALAAAADRSAIRQGYGQRLARTAIKLRKEDAGYLNADRLYWNICRGRRALFADRLRELGWSGEEEDLKDDKDILSDHFETE